MGLRQHGQTFGVLAWALLALGCPEENLQQTRPRLEVCPKADASPDDCNRTLALGDLPLTVPQTLELFVRNVGDGTLDVSAVTSGNSQLAVVEFPPQVATAAAMPLRLVVTPNMLGAVTVDVTLSSNDADTPERAIQVTWNGTPKPVPQLTLCSGDTCGRDLTVDFGTVRRSQRESRTVVVSNTGTAVLNISAVERMDQSSTAGELDVLTSTRPGFLPPGATAPLTLLYEPRDGVMDRLVITFTSDDPQQATARITALGLSTDNLPPTADARRNPGGETAVEVMVGEVVALDGTASSDPEGDPLRYRWTLTPPATSTVSLPDPTAARVLFTPDRAGTYRAELAVLDSLDQPSPTQAVVLVNARPRYALRVQLEWPTGGDVDVHLVPSGQAVFGPQDCYWANPRPEVGDMLSLADNPSLLSDSQQSPGREEVVFERPRDGSFDVYAHLFDEGGLGAPTVTASIMFNDSGTFAAQLTQMLPATCSLWHVGTVLFPAATFTPSAAALTLQCQ